MHWQWVALGSASLGDPRLSTSGTAEALGSSALAVGGARVGVTRGSATVDVWTSTVQFSTCAFFRAWTEALVPVLVAGAHVLVASNPLVSHLVASAVCGGGLERRGEVVRLVMTMRGGDRPKNAHEEFSAVTVMPRSKWEPWLLFRKPLEGRVQDNLRTWRTGGLRRISGDQPFADVIMSAPTGRAERKLAPHPSLKPQAFLRQVVRAILPLGEGVVLDPFAGSGSTLAAAEYVGYRSAGIERDPSYARLAVSAIPKLRDYEPASSESSARSR